MADALQTQEAGGGEGAPAPPATPTQDPKPASSDAQDVKPAAVEPQQVTEQTEAKKEPEPEPTQPVEAKQEEVKPTEVKPTEVKPTAEPSVDQNGNDVAQNNTDTKDANWQQRELELLKKIEELEKVKNERTEDGLKLELKVREEEIDLLKARVKNLETELQAALSKPSGKNHEMIENIKQQHEELLSKARGMIFDKTKMVKNQELQIEALTTQVQSLKDINQITKDLLEIRNSEIKAMEDRLAVMETRFKTEKERFGLVLQRAQTSSNINGDLKKEYETQLAIFKELREKYEQRVKALVAENERLKASITPNDTSGSSTSATK
ncbi:epidermal growth factor receptor substrate 15 homolog [Ostrinia nubilalis]|uniref:epidermal growth factor receptor substrate 15 homolog n=1 Tax=Ostrinia nubilalis TaxID=29057 RepID=UPI0030824CAD